jgi:hypothetical protein
LVLCLNSATFERIAFSIFFLSHLSSTNLADFLAY